MKDDGEVTSTTQHSVSPSHLATPAQGAMYCVPSAEGHCVSCSDEALQARVLRVDQETGLALVTVNDVTEEIDITLVESVGLGDLVLVHGGVAITRVGETNDE